MPLCVLSVDVHKDVREVFNQFSTLTRVIREAIAARACSDLAGFGLDIENIRGQGYDAASNMSCSHVDLQALIKEKAPLALYPLQWTLWLSVTLTVYETFLIK